MQEFGHLSVKFMKSSQVKICRMCLDKSVKERAGKAVTHFVHQLCVLKKSLLRIIFPPLVLQSLGGF